MDVEQQSLARSNVAAYGCALAALLLVLFLGCWGLYRDLKLDRATILQGAASQLRAQAARRAGHLESAMTRIGPGVELADLEADPWFRRYWAGVTPLAEQQSYAAIVGVDGRIVFHDKPELEGEQLSRKWYDRVIDEVGDDVVESGSTMLASGERSYDVRIPLVANGRRLGDYHEGLKKSWVDQRLSANRALVWQHWSTVIGSILVVITFSLLSLYYMARRSIAWRQAIALAHTQRVTEVGQLAAGLAHEIRNPLHAIRLNLHTLRRALKGDAKLEPSDVEMLTSQSQDEIARIDQLLRELLGYASPEQACNEDIDLCEEVRATVDFLAKEVERDHVDLDVDLPVEPAVAHIDKNRFRQILLNLLLNAKDVMTDGGTVHLSVRPLPKQTEIVVADEGPGIPHQDREKVFEPFYTTKEDGTGFGLAIVKRFVHEAGGTVDCSSNGHQGARFRIALPRYRNETGAAR